MPGLLILYSIGETVWKCARSLGPNFCWKQREKPGLGIKLVYFLFIYLFYLFLLDGKNYAIVTKFVVAVVVVVAAAVDTAVVVARLGQIWTLLEAMPFWQ